MTTPSTPRPTTDAMAAFRRFPVGITVFLGLFVAAGLYLASRHLGAEAIAMCGDDTMAPGDMCTMSSGRRRRRAGGGTSTYTYEERLEAAARGHEAWVWAGIAVAVIAVIFIVLVVIRWRRDTALARTLDGQQAPVTSYSTTTSIGAGMGFLGAAAVGAGGLGVGVWLRGVSDLNPIGLAIMAAGAVSGLVILWMARPKGSTLVWAYDSHVRIVTQSRSHDVAWEDMQYFVDLQSSSFMELGWTGSKRQLSIDDEEFFATMRARINTLTRARVERSAETGEPVDFRAVTLAGRTVTFRKKKLDAGSLAAINLVKEKDNLSLHVRDREGATQVIINPAEIANLDVLLHVLSQTYGVVVPGR
ncbi:hypothetical protein ACPYO6_13920 [Georgenia sp. Z1344]|uniref:hypothetical protein n=1 Tax=Georgenia sp. Z1344 TaxID=3416706 RepID=UPI003CEA9D72